MMTMIPITGGILLGAALGAFSAWQIAKQIGRDIIDIDTPKEVRDG